MLCAKVCLCGQTPPHGRRSVRHFGLPAYSTTLWPASIQYDTSVLVGIFSCSTSGTLLIGGKLLFKTSLHQTVYLATCALGRCIYKRKVFVGSDTCLAELQYCQDGRCLGTYKHALKVMNRRALVVRKYTLQSMERTDTATATQLTLTTTTIIVTIITFK